MSALALPLLGFLAGNRVAPAVDVALSSSTRAEAAVGSAPQTPGAESESTFETTLTPTVVLSGTTARSVTALTVEPRVTYRLPNPGGIERPLVLVRGGVTRSYQVSRTLDWTTEFGAVYGEVDYAHRALASGNALSSGVTEPVIRSLSLNAGTAFAMRLSEIRLFGIGIEATHTREPGALPEEGSPVTTSVGVPMQYTMEVDPRSSLALVVSPFRHFVDPGADWHVLSVDLQFRRELGRRTTADFGVGASVAAAQGGPAAFFPQAGAGLTRVLHERRGARVSNRIALTLSASYDPTLGVVRPVGAFESAWTADLADRWTLVLSAGAATALDRAEPTTGAAVDPTAAETTLHASAEARYRISRAVVFGLGARHSSTGPRLGTEDFRLANEEYFAFASVTVSFGSAGEGDPSGGAGSGSTEIGEPPPSEPAPPGGTPPASPGGSPAAPTAPSSSPPGSETGGASPPPASLNR